MSARSPDATSAVSGWAGVACSADSAGEDDVLWQNLRELPAFRALLRAVETGLYADLPLARPMLDLGCGDGHFGRVTFRAAVEVGLDPCWEELAEARGRSAHRLLTRAEGVRIPCPADSFATVVGNSVLEHIALPQPVLEEVARVLRPDGLFCFSVPGPGFVDSLSVGRVLDWAGATCLGEAYRHFFNTVSDHKHCDASSVWRDRLERCGMGLERWLGYFPPEAMVVFEWLHYFGLPSLASKRIFGRWVLCPSRSNLRITELLVRPVYEHAVRWQGAGAYLFFVARKRNALRGEGVS